MIDPRMTVSQKALIKACNKLDLPYEIIHRDNIAIKLTINNQRLLFIHHHKPFNRADTQRISKDKDLSYHLLHKVVDIPRWIPYLDPGVDEKYFDYLRFFNNTEIVNNIEENLSYPFIIKRNMGSMGSNVFEVKNREEALDALDRIFDKESSQYDYVALAQEKIQIEQEYRVIMYKGKALLAYLKDISSAEFEGNLSPLHWKESSAIKIDNQELISKFEKFSNPIFKELDIVYTGLDIAIDTSGKMWLIELNGSPAVKQYTDDNGDRAVVEMYEYILQDLRTSS
jgi:carbamoylphosphate synthase large subunit